MSNGRKTTVLNLFSVEFKRVFGEFESFLNEGSKFTDTAALLSKDFLGMGGTDDNLSDKFPLRKTPGRQYHKDRYLRTSVGDANITTRVALLREFTGEEFVQFGAEDTIGNKLALLANLGGHFLGG